jgi:hypothetical protein
MFFFGIFGVNTKTKDIKDLNNVTCSRCGRFGVYRLVKEFSYFHFFFIPLYKWGQKYFLVSRCCKSVFSVSAEKGIRLEQGIDFSLEDHDLQYMFGEEKHDLDQCPNCDRQLDRSFEFCPYCGKHISSDHI